MNHDFCRHLGRCRNSDRYAHRFQSSIALVRAHLGSGIACSAHTLAETYSTLTAYKLPRRMRTQEAYSVVQRWREVCTVVTLSTDEYLDLLRDAADRDIRGGTVYDALHIACARKIAAERIYTWNTRHFKLAAPDLAHIILKPATV